MLKKQLATQKQNKAKNKTKQNKTIKKNPQTNHAFSKSHLKSLIAKFNQFENKAKIEL